MYSLKVALLLAVAIASVRSQNSANRGPRDVCNINLPYQKVGHAFRITYSPTRPQPGRPVDVNITMRTPCKEIMVLCKNCNNETVGNWSATECNTNIIDCGTGNAATVSNELNSVRLRWTPPCAGIYRLIIVQVLEYGCSYAQYIARTINIEERQTTMNDCEAAE